MAREAEGGGRRERARETVAKINKRWRRVGRSGQVRLCAALARSAESRGRTENAQTRHRRQIEARARGRSGTRARCKTGWGGGRRRREGGRATFVPAGIVAAAATVAAANAISSPVPMAAAESRVFARTRERACAYRVFILRRIVISRALSRRKEPGIIEPVPYRARIPVTRPSASPATYTSRIAPGGYYTRAYKRGRERRERERGRAARGRRVAISDHPRPPFCSVRDPIVLAGRTN